MAEEVTGEKKTLDLSSEMPAIEGVETDEELLLARDVTSAFVKAVKAARFYPADNPTVIGFRDQFFKKTQFFLNKYQHYILQIGEYEFSYKGNARFYLLLVLDFTELIAGVKADNLFAVGFDISLRERRVEEIRVLGGGDVRDHDFVGVGGFNVFVLPK